MCERKTESGIEEEEKHVKKRLKGEQKSGESER